MPLHADDRTRLLRAAEDRPLGERLLAHLVVNDGLTLAQAVALRHRDFSGSSVTVETKTGERETHPLGRQTVELARRATSEVAPDAPIVTGRAGSPLSAATAREILLGLGRASGVPVWSVHQVRGGHHPIVAA